MRQRRRGNRFTGSLFAAAILLAGCSNGDAITAGPSTTGPSTTADSSTTAATTTVAPNTSAPTITGAPVAACASPVGSLTPGRNTVQVGGEPREFLLAVPPGLDPTAATPVVLNFHGSGSDMDQQAVYSRLPEDGTARGYIVVTPQGTGSPRGWSLAGPGTDDAFVDALLSTLRGGACVDDDRVFATGISNGSAYSALYACRHPEVIAAVGMVAATLPSLCPVDHPMPAMAFHGDADPVVPYVGGGVAGRRSGVEAPGAESSIAQWAQRNGCGAVPVETAIGGDVTERAWTACRDGADVTFFSIRGGGHTWPGGIDLAGIGKAYLGATTRSVSATERLLDFFDAVGRTDG